MAIKERIVQASRLIGRKPNVVYLGAKEALQLRCETGAVNNVNRFMGMKVISVRLESWLQVAFVEGVK